MNSDKFQYEICDAERTNIHDLKEYDRGRYASALETLPSGMSASGVQHLTFDNLLNDRIECNKIMNPLVSAVRKKYGVPHAYDSPNFIPDENGKYILLPNLDDEYIFTRYSLYVSGYLDRTFEEKGLHNNEAREQIVKLIMVNRFHVNEDDYRLNTMEYDQNIKRLIFLALVEAGSGYKEALLYSKQDM